MADDPRAEPGRDERVRATPTASALLDDGTLVELVYRRDERRTAFVLWREDGWRLANAVTLRDRQRLVPFSADNNLIRHPVVLLPSEPEEYGTTEDLFGDIRSDHAAVARIHAQVVDLKQPGIRRARLAY